MERPFWRPWVSNPYGGLIGQPDGVWGQLGCLLTKAHRNGWQREGIIGSLQGSHPPAPQPQISKCVRCHLPALGGLPLSFINITLFYYLAPLFTNIREEWNSCQGVTSNSKSPLRIIARGSSEFTLLAAFRLSRHTRTLPWRPAAPLGRGVPQAFRNFPFSLFRLFSTIFSIVHFRWTIFQFCLATSATTGNVCQEKCSKRRSSSWNGTAGWELHKVGKWQLWTLTHRLAPCKSFKHLTRPCSSNRVPVINSRNAREARVRPQLKTVGVIKAFSMGPTVTLFLTRLIKLSIVLSLVLC